HDHVYTSLGDYGINNQFLVIYRYAVQDPTTTDLYPLSLHDALPISGPHPRQRGGCAMTSMNLASAVSFAVLLPALQHRERHRGRDRKSTRLNSSHVKISYAVFCLKKKNLHAHRRPAQDSNPGLPCAA